MSRLFILVVAALFPLHFQGPDARLEQFQLDAEHELRRPILITESDATGMHNGETSCDSNPVRIRVRKGLDPETREEVLAHELGHAYLCGRGLLIRTTNTQAAATDRLEGVAAAIGAAIGSCYIDPLVNAEMAKRGFKTEKIVEAVLRKAKSYTKQEIHDSIAQGDLYAQLSAIVTYCLELEFPSLPAEKFEAIFKDEPSVMAKIRALQRDLGTPTCSDTASCVHIIKRLRDEFELKRYVGVWNPDTNNFE